MYKFVRGIVTTVGQPGAEQPKPHNGGVRHLQEELSTREGGGALQVHRNYKGTVQKSLEPPAIPFLKEL